MNTKQNTFRLLGAGLAVLAIGIAASGRPAAAQSPLLSRPAQVQQIFGGWTHADSDHYSDRDRDNDRNWDRRRAAQARREAEQARREAERARHEAEVRHAEWLRGHRNDRDHNRDRDREHPYGEGRRDNR